MALGMLSVLWMFSQHPFSAQIQARNAQREADAQRLLHAIASYESVSSHPPLPIPYREHCGGNSLEEICRTSAPCQKGVDLSVLTKEGLLSSLPIDPQASDAGGTGYFAVHVKSGGTIICAPRAENGVKIEVGG